MLPSPEQSTIHFPNREPGVTNSWWRRGVLVVKGDSIIFFKSLLFIAMAVAGPIDGMGLVSRPR